MPQLAGATGPLKDVVRQPQSSAGDRELPNAIAGDQEPQKNADDAPDLTTNVADRKVPNAIVGDPDRAKTGTPGGGDRRREKEKGTGIDILHNTHI